MLLVRVIETRRCSSLRHAKICKFLKVTIRNTKPELLRKRKKKVKSIVVRSSHYFRYRDNLVYSFVDNGLVLLKKRMNSMGKEIYGPSSKHLKIKKFRIAFSAIF